jgi:hypothetical protein
MASGSLPHPHDYLPGGKYSKTLARVLPKLIGAHRSANIPLLHVYCIQSIVLALFSIITGAKFWLVKPEAIKICDTVSCSLSGRADRVP